MIEMEYSEIPVTKISGSGRVTLQGYGDVKISGSGSISPERIRTSGSSKLPGGLKVGDIHTSGSTTVGGSISADTMKFSGSATIEGDAEFKELDKSGSMRIEGTATGDIMEVSGSTKIGGKLTIKKELRSSGSIRVHGDIESEGLVRYSGTMDTQGKITAKRFEAHLGRSVSRIDGGIEAEYIDVELSPRAWRDEGELKTTDIIGVKEVTLENVNCHNVRGGIVVIKAGCKVSGKVEYTDSVEVSPNAYLENQPEKIE
ncbi:MAG: hypothetical protein NWE89_08390 [Candidatus Bathyarchaeota archaeon]|nr:hypothetical protein [Candidatus Bathyarchaeota archaeon]